MKPAAADTQALTQLLQRIDACRQCEAQFGFTPRPVVQAGTGARLLIVGQAPGSRVHATGIPWNDPSGARLRSWLGMDAQRFYDPQQVAIIPAALCYPGKGKSGDLPPPKVCAPLWHPPLLQQLPNLRLTLLIGQYAQAYYLGRQRQATLTATVQAWRRYLPDYLPLPHPSPRNQGWWKQHPWFGEELLPELRVRVQALWAD